MKYSFLRIKFIPHRNDEGFSRQGRNLSERNFQGAWLLEKETVK